MKALRQLKHQLRDIPTHHCWDFGDYRNSTFLAGTGRSGTTWVEEFINYDNSYRIMFEPFHALKIDELKSWNYRQYLRKDDRNPEFIEPAHKILSGKIRHEWIDAFNHKLVARKRLIKDIRSQLFLHWIKANFPEIPIILLVRHPCAVANSKLKLGWDVDLNNFLDQEDLMADFLHPFEESIRRANEGDIFEKHIFLWCIENYVPLKQFQKDEILIVFYEDICTTPEPEIERLFKFLGKPYSTKIFNALSKPSALSQSESAIKSGLDLVTSWRRWIDDRQLMKARGICRLFGLDILYGEDSLPQISGADVLAKVLV